MDLFIRAILSFCALFASHAFASVHVAVLETLSTVLTAKYDFTIMTREDIRAKLPSGKSVEDCDRLADMDGS